MPRERNVERWATESSDTDTDDSVYLQYEQDITEEEFDDEPMPNVEEYIEDPNGLTFDNPFRRINRIQWNHGINSNQFNLDECRTKIRWYDRYVKNMDAAIDRAIATVDNNNEKQLKTFKSLKRSIRNYNALIDENIVLTDEIYRLKHVNKTQTDEILDKLRQINEERDAETDSESD
jgi:hypothetical protein